MSIVIHPHAKERMAQRGATEEEVITTIELGEHFEAKYGRIGFRRNFPYNGIWLGKYYFNKQVELYVVEENGDRIVVSVLAKYF